MGANAGKDFKRGALAVLTSGTSEIKTGGGEHGDETVADSLFPKTVNNFMLEDRENARGASDVAKAKALAQSMPVAPDATDDALSSTRRAAAARLLNGQGRANSFIGGL